MANQRRIDLIVSIVGEDVKPFAEKLVAGTTAVPPSDTPAAIQPTGTTTQASFDRAAFVNDLAKLFDDDPAVVVAIANDSKITNMEELALNYGKEQFEQILSPPTLQLVLLKRCQLIAENHFHNF